MKHTYRQPDHARSNRIHTHGRILPMADEDRLFWQLRKERAR